MFVRAIVFIAKRGRKVYKQTVTAISGRTFATFPVAILAFVINQKEEFLFLKPPAETGWEIPSGGLEAGESPLQGLDRELHEELGAAFKHSVLGPVHATLFRYDDRVTNMLSLGFAVQHLDGDIVPGDDMAGAQCLWLTIEEIRNRGDIAVPDDINLFSYALDVFHSRNLADKS